MTASANPPANAPGVVAILPGVLQRLFPGAPRRVELEARVQAANRELAAAISASDGDASVVQPAVDHFHDAMGELQKETILHVLAMRAILTPEQARQFDARISESLTEQAS